MVQLVSVAGLIGYLDEFDQTIRSYALKKLDSLVDEYWAEIADSVSKIEELYEDESFPDRKLAALVASKVFYHLGEFEESMNFALGAGELFDISAKSEYVQTIIEKCVDKYIHVNSVNAAIQDSAADPNSAILEKSKKTTLGTESPQKQAEKLDSRLQDVVEKMFNKCYEAEDYRPAIGIAIEARRLDVVERGIKLAGERGKSSKSKDESADLMQYVLEIAMTVVQEITLRNDLLRLLLNLFLQQSPRDYFSISKCVVHLEDHVLAGRLLKELVAKEDSKSLATAYQIAFDLESSSTQEFVGKVIAELPESDDETSSEKDGPSSTTATAGGDTVRNDDDATESSSLLRATDSSSVASSPHTKLYKSIRQILRGSKTIGLQLEFLYRNNKTDITILNKLRDSLEPRSSIFHSAVTFSAAFTNAGTTNDSF